METVNCNICGSSQYQEKYIVSDYLLERPDVISTLVQCTECGLIYQNPRLTVDEMNRHYPNDYEPYETKEVQSKSWLLRKAIEYGISKRIRFITRYKKHGRILDIGCASGVFLDGIRTCGEWDTYGVEPSIYAASLAKKKLGSNIFVGTLEKAHYRSQFFDVVTMWDVLEHIHNPKSTLQEIHRVLAPDGLLVIRVPNEESFQARVFGKYWAGLDAPRHLFVFSPQTLSRLLFASGFETVNVSYNSASYLIFVLSLRFWMVEKGTKKQTRERILNLLNHPISRLISAPLFYLLGFFCKGPSMVIAARKKS